MLPSSIRLDYQHLTPANEAPFVSLAQDRHVRQYLMEGLEMSAEECRELIGQSELLWRQMGLGLYLISKNNSVVGYCGFMKAHGCEGDIDVVYAFPQEHTGQGFATEACEALVKLFISTKHSKKLTAVAHPDNIASIRVLEKNGFVNVGPGLGDLGHLLRYQWRGY